MSQEYVLATVKKAFSDDIFRLALVKDFDKTIAENSIDLTANESAELKKVDWANYAGLGAGGGGDWVHVYST
ncbi:hypothetical protein [Paraburkholderia sp.]|uniref:hypothetical protein n=1 Tax=Paraburkholderia sp. TaxID=1926495 RepID=UPI00286F4CC5|nr:hypothetical protein [Paraburkholderia sp.]